MSREVLAAAWSQTLPYKRADLLMLSGCCLQLHTFDGILDTRPSILEFLSQVGRNWSIAKGEILAGEYNSGMLHPWVAQNVFRPNETRVEGHDDA